MSELDLDAVMIALGWVFLGIVAVYILLITYVIIDGLWDTLKIRQRDLDFEREGRERSEAKVKELRERVNELQERIDFLTKDEVKL